MKIKHIKDNKNRIFFSKFEYFKKVYKILLINFLNNTNFIEKRRYFFQKLLNIQYKMNKISKTQVKNRCILTNRSRSVLRHYSLSRIKMRELLRFGILPGYKKSAW